MIEKEEIISIPTSYFSEGDTYGLDYAVSTMIYELARLADFDLEEV